MPADPSAAKERAEPVEYAFARWCAEHGWVEDAEAPHGEAFYAGWQAGRNDGIDTTLGAVAADRLPDPACDYCGSLGWTVEKYGRVLHKQACPHRGDDPWSQSVPPSPVSAAVSPAEPPERVQMTTHKVVIDCATEDDAKTVAEWLRYGGHRAYTEFHRMVERGGNVTIERRRS